MTLGITAGGLTAAAAVGGLGLSAYNTFAGPGGGGGGGYDMAMMQPTWQSAPQYPWTEGLLGDIAGYTSENLARIREGRYPDYFEAALPTFRKNLTRPLQEFYEGTPGQRTGALQKAYEVGSITGLGPANVAAGVDKQLYDYATKEQQIDEYLTKLGFDVMQQGAFGFPQLGLSIPRGPEGAFTSPYSPSVPMNSGNPLMNTLGQVGGNILGQAAGYGIDKLFNMGGGGAAGSTSMPGYFGNDMLGNMLPTGGYLNYGGGPNPSVGGGGFSGVISNPYGGGDIIGIT